MLGRRRRQPAARPELVDDDAFPEDAPLGMQLAWLGGHVVGFRGELRETNDRLRTHRGVMTGLAISVALDILLSAGIIHNTIGQRSSCEAGNQVRTDIVRLFDGLITNSEAQASTLTPAERAQQEQQIQIFQSELKTDLAPRACGFWQGL